MELLPYGKRIACGGFNVLKHTVALSGKEMAELRAGMPDEAVRGLERGSMPVITVSDAAGSWSVTFAPTQDMYRVIDSTGHEASEDGALRLTGGSAEALEGLFALWRSVTTGIYDKVFYSDVTTAVSSWIGRMGHRNRKPLRRKENRRVMEESERQERDRSTLMGLAGEITDIENNGYGDKD